MTSTNEKPSEFDVLLDSYLGELIEMPDDEVIGSDDPSELKAIGLQILDSAKAEAGRRRLLAAKERLASRRKVDPDSGLMPMISAQEAKNYIRQVSNDPRFTLAARNLDEMSDEDAIRLYEQIQRLEQASEGSGGGEV